MSKFKVGDRVRCVNAVTCFPTILKEQEYVVRKVDDENVWVVGVEGGFLKSRFEPIHDSSYSVEADLTADDYAFLLNEAFAATFYGLPKSSGIPETARAILNIIPEKKVVATPEQKAQADNIDRAVRNIYRRDDAFVPAASVWEP